MTTQNKYVEMGTNDKPYAPPCEELYIYYLRGNADTRDTDFGNSFLGNWEEDGFSFLFFSQKADVKVKKLLSRQPDLILLDSFIMPYEQWQPLDDFPIRAGGFTIYPPWLKPAGKDGNRTIILDPGVVFGSGCHATTSDCLEALDLITSRNRGTPRSAVDIGTGTGLLSIAAAITGIERVIGIDINFLAASTALRNAGLNNVSDRVMFIKGDAKELSSCIKTDLFIANIHYDIMKDLLGSPSFESCSSFILSGLMRSQAWEIVSALKKMPVTLTKEWNSDGIWYTFMGDKH